MEERRKSKRLELDSKLILTRLDSEKSEEIFIKVGDISKTGLGFTSDTALNIGAVYEAFLTIWTQEIIHAFVEIVRIEKLEDGFEYGGIFVGMPEIDAQRIEIYDTVQNLAK